MDYLKGDERRGLLRTGIVVASTLGEQTFPQNGAILSVNMAPLAQMGSI